MPPRQTHSFAKPWSMYVLWGVQSWGLSQYGMSVFTEYLFAFLTPHHSFISRCFSLKVPDYYPMQIQAVPYSSVHISKLIPRALGQDVTQPSTSKAETESHGLQLTLVWASPACVCPRRKDDSTLHMGHLTAPGYISHTLCVIVSAPEGGEEHAKSPKCPRPDSASGLD